MITDPDVAAASPRVARFASLLRIRMVEEAIAERYPDQEMRCPVHLSIGQEAVAVGVCAALERRDYVMSTHRAHAHYLAKGGDLRAMIAELFGRADGCSGGRGGSMHLIDLTVNFLGATPIVGSTAPVAVGTAFASWMRGEDRVSAVFFGDGMTEEGVFSEALNFAALKALPVVFICENNLFSVYSPLGVRQAERRDRVEIARAHGMHAERADGNDLDGVFGVTRGAVRRARSGGGPSFLEFDTYRHREHCGPAFDNDLGYRTEAEAEAWLARDPVGIIGASLLHDGIISAASLESMQAVIADEINAAFAYAAAAAPPAEADFLDGVYAEDNR